MQCPKCKNYISDNVLRCPNCNLKVKIVCPKCNTVSPMGKKFCAECGYSFFTKCPECQTMNLSTSDFCRKCGNPLKQEEVTENTVIENVIEKPSPDNLNETAFESSEEVTDDILTKETSENEPVDTNKVSDTAKKTENSEQISEADMQETKPLYTPDGFLISNDEVELSEDEINTLFEKVEDFEKSQARKAEAEAIVQQKFDEQEEKSENEEIIPAEYVQLNQQDAQTTIIDAIQNPLKKIISLNGKEGYGKSLILKYVREALRQNYIWAWGECNALTQITPFGYLQDVLLNLFNLSNFSINLEDFIKNNTKALEAQFYNLNSKEINDLFNFLYPHKTSEFNGILKRKDYTINILKKVFENLSMKAPVIFVADDFENMDGASFDFLKNIISDEKFNEKIKILITNKFNKIAQGYFYNKDLKPNNYSNIFLSGLDDKQCLSLVNTLFGADVDLPENIKKQLIENSKGTSSYIEQACLLLNEMDAIVKNADLIIFNHDFDDYILPVNTHRILEERLASLEKDYPVVVKALYFASILGNKFSSHQFENVLQFLKITKDDYNLICNYLIEKNFITLFSENYYVFNNTLIWHYIFERAKTDENFEEYNKNIYASVLSLSLSNNSLKPLLLQNFGNKKESFIYWQKNAQYASYLGDTNLYVISLKQQLKISDEITDIISVQEKIQIFERMGKILYKLSPKEAVNYLSASIAYHKENNNPIRIIELSAFLVQACKITGNYFGVIEACDVALNSLTSEYEVEKALIASKKLNALLHLGNCEEIINLSKTELLDVIENALAKSHTSEIASDENIFEIWLDTSLNLASAYAIQGNKKVFEVLTKVDDAIIANQKAEEKYQQKILITKALAYTMRGEVKLSSETLTQITSKYSTEDMEEDYILKWNLINVINKVITKDYQNLVDEMFQVTTFADNINNAFIKNILKLMLGYIIQTKSNNIVKAVEIYNEEIVFFSKEKIATGALLCWYLISNASMITKGIDFALDIALKALDVAKGPKINNYLFIVGLKLLIADIYMIKQDFEAAKMYLEKAMTIAQNNDLRFMQMKIFQAFAKYNEEMISIYKDNAQSFAQGAVDMYKEALKISQNLMLSYYENFIQKDLTAFKVSCQLKNITVIAED